MGQYIIQRGEAEPYPNGTRFKLKSTGLPGVIIKQCFCTSPNLHYEVKLDMDDHVTISGHLDLVVE